MSVRRLAITTAAMTVAAALLAALIPQPSVLAAAAREPQRFVDVAGPDAAVLALVGLLAGAVWLWGAVGLGLTAASVLPGAVGSAARCAVRMVLPVAARRGMALALGVGLGVSGPLVLVSAISLPPAMAESPDGAFSDGAFPAGPDGPATVPDWPPAATPPDWPSRQPVGPAAQLAPDAPPSASASAEPASGPAPDWPGPLAADSHVVLRGECLWDIAAADLRMRLGRTPRVGEVAVAVQAWWQANQAVIGADPDLLIPGQVLQPPEQP